MVVVVTSGPLPSGPAPRQGAPPRRMLRPLRAPPSPLRMPRARPAPSRRRRPFPSPGGGAGRAPVLLVSAPPTPGTCRVPERRPASPSAPPRSPARPTRIPSRGRPRSRRRRPRRSCRSARSRPPSSSPPPPPASRPSLRVRPNARLFTSHPAGLSSPPLRASAILVEGAGGRGRHLCWGQEPFRVLFGPGGASAAEAAAVGGTGRVGSGAAPHVPPPIRPPCRDPPPLPFPLLLPLSPPPSITWWRSKGHERRSGRSDGRTDGRTDSPPPHPPVGGGPHPDSSPLPRPGKGGVVGGPSAGLGVGGGPGFLTRPVLRRRLGPARRTPRLLSQLLPRSPRRAPQPRWRAMSSTPGPGPPLVAVCQVTSTPDKERSFSGCAGLVREAAAAGAVLACLPEAFDFIARDPAETLRLAEPLAGDLIGRYGRLARECGLWLSLGGFHERGPDWETTPRIYNCHVLLDGHGAVVATYRKTHLCDVELPGQGPMRESGHTLPGPALAAPVDTPAGKVLLRARAIETQCYVVAAAQCGRHHGQRASYGHSLVVDPWGTVVARGSEGPGLLLAPVDLDHLRHIRRQIPVFQHRRPDLYGHLGRALGGHPTGDPGP
uniref:CN hydrolase domain-containing protein n=1 Tax=Ornithorhynchus anatinus TaxID=9258 RepID=A0A6I8PD39_ORNAN